MQIIINEVGAIVFVLAELIGILSAVHAVMNVRTSQGAIAWTVSLVTFPWISVPLYWVFGRNRFRGYRETLETAFHHSETQRDVEAYNRALAPYQVEVDPDFRAIEALTGNWFLRGNRVDLLIDGTATFDAIFEAVAAARRYVLVEFFIIKDDGLGQRLKDALIAKANEGVRVYLLYDEMGSHKLPRAYLRELREHHVEVTPFGANQGRLNRFQLNFRNHRKIVVVDGDVAFVGGHNVGDEYLGLSPRFGHWRDTHVRIEGPAVQQAQAVFVTNWYWAVREVPRLEWEVTPATDGSDMPVLVLPTGPVDPIESCTLMFHSLINRARRRVWIASPYFVPDEGIQQALQLAALRGVDVRILIPADPDHKMVYLAAFSYLEAMDDAGVGIFRYEKGFLHQKVALVDDRLGMVSTANLDNRSFRLNFEISVLAADAGFAGSVEAMLLEDFRNSRRIDSTDFTGRPFAFRAAVRAARLLAPIL